MLQEATVDNWQARIKQPGTILVVDDEADNRDLLGELLNDHGHQVIEAVDGAQALEQVARVSVDVILLDVMMPKMDGFEVCHRLKSNTLTAPIPILMITALRKRQDRIKAIASGANDFITKPIDLQDVLLRVRNAVYTKHLFDQLRENYHQLQEMETLRHNLTQMIIHDLGSPLMVITGTLELVKLQIKEPDILSMLETACQNTTTLIEMIDCILDVNRMEAHQMPLKLVVCDLYSLAAAALALLGPLKDKHKLHYQPQRGSIMVRCDVQLLRRVFVNLLTNAIKFTPAGGQIEVTITPKGSYVRVEVRDNGTGIAPEYHDKIFDKFSALDVPVLNCSHSTGLGLTFCKLVIQAHQGRIGVESTPGQGSTFWFELPCISAHNA